MEPSFISEDFEDLDELDEERATTNQRPFMIVIIGLGAILALAVIVVLVVILGRSDEKSAIELTNEAVVQTNAAVQKAIEETGTAEVVVVTSQAGTAEAARELAQAATAEVATNTAAALATEDAQPTATNTPTRTPVVASPTTATSGEGNGTPGEGTAVAQVTGTAALPTRTPVSTQSSSVPDTGVGGLAAVLFAAVLIVVVFVVRRLRTAI